MFPPPSPAGGRPAHKSKGGALWGQVVQDNRGQERQDSRRSGGYNSGTPHYEDRSTPRYGSSGSRTPSERSGGARTPGGGGRTPQDRRGGDRQQIMLRDSDWYAGHGVQVRVKERVCAIHRVDQEVETESGVRVPYDRLVIATGGFAFRPPIDGSDLEHVVTYRSIEDAEAILRRARPVPHGHLRHEERQEDGEGVYSVQCFKSR